MIWILGWGEQNCYEYLHIDLSCEHSLHFCGIGPCLQLLKHVLILSLVRHETGIQTYRETSSVFITIRKCDFFSSPHPCQFYSGSFGIIVNLAFLTCIHVFPHCGFNLCFSNDKQTALEGILLLFVLCVASDKMSLLGAMFLSLGLSFSFSPLAICDL